MTTSRLQEIQKMFDEIGLGRPEDRQRFCDLAGDSILRGGSPEDTPQEQLFIRLENNTPEAEEVQHG